jgi:hypothetical protein
VAGFNIDCEKVPVGVCPRELTRAGCFGDQGDFVVTDEVAHYGRRCLKGFEHEGLAKSFYPYLVYQMHGQKVERGKVTFRFAFRNHPQTPGHLVVEFRDYANRGAREFLTGPLVEFTADGTVTADQTRLAALPAGEWCEAQVRFELGPNAPKTYAVTITPAAGAPVTVSVPYRHQDFAVATWLGIVSAGTNTAAFYLDDLRLTVE